MEIRNRQLYVNDELIPDPPKMNSLPYADYPRRTLKDNEYFVVGDNRGNSHDSRYSDVGPISKKDIVGKVTRVILPLGNARAVK